MSDPAALANRLRKNARHLAKWARREGLEGIVPVAPRSILIRQLERGNLAPSASDFRHLADALHGDPMLAEEVDVLLAEEDEEFLEEDEAFFDE